MNMQSRRAQARLVVVAAILQVLTLLGVPAAVNAAAPCGHDEVCGLKNAEDLVRLAGTHWAIAGRMAKDPEAPGGFSLVDLEGHTARVLIPDVSKPAAAEYADCPGAPVPSELITHGLDIRRQQNGASELFAVNHGGRQSIEIFAVHVQAGGPKLTWKGCLILPSDVAANAVAALPDGVAVTSFGSAGEQGMAELLAGSPAGFVDRWSPKKGWTRVAGSDFGGDNGIAAPPGGSALYVNDWIHGTLRILSLRAGVAPVTLKVGDFHPDNLHFLADGRLLIAGQIGTARDIMECAQQAACTVGSMIAVVDPTARNVRSHWIVPPTSTFGAAATALLYGNDYWASSFRGDRIVRLGPMPGR